MKNLTSLIGRIGNQLELKTFDNGAVLNISLAVEDNYRKSDTKEIVERTQWIDCVARNDFATLINDNFVKGDQLAILGKLIKRSYEKDNQTFYVTEVIIQSIEWIACQQAKHNKPKNENK